MNSNVLSTYARRPADADNLGASRYTAYTWDVRNMVDTVKSGASPTSSLDSWSYTYDPRAMRSTVTKPNGNVATVKYHEDGLPRTLVERTSADKGSQLVSSHSLKFNSDGDRSEDVEKLDQPGSTGFLDQVSKYTYTPSRQLASVDRSGADAGDDESYVYDAAGNAKTQTIGSVTSTMTYDRNRLVKTVSGSTVMNHRYDVFGRSTTVDVGAQVIERNAYDGYDRLIRQQKFNTAGVRQSLKSTKFDPFDRTSSHGTLVAGQSASTWTRFVYLGLQEQIAAEEQANTAGTYEVSKVFTHGPGGEKLAVIDTPVNGTTTKKHFYGINPHGDVETLTDATTGQTTSTYRYTAYGKADKKGTLGEDAITGDAVKDAEVVNPYRFNSKRFDGATGTYDMGFREYDPGLNRFLTRDNYNGALSDMALGSDPWTVNRYAFAGGNPITGIELDGHEPCDPAVSNCDLLYCGSSGCDVNGGTTGGYGTFRDAEESSKPTNKVDDVPVEDIKRHEYDSLVNYLHSEIVNNSKSATVKAMRDCNENFWPICAAGAYKLWYDQVRTGGPWDHKMRILKSLRMIERGSKFTPLPDGWRAISYEVWSNIHYGYVGREAGFSSWELHDGANLADLASQLTTDSGDQTAVQIGIDLWERHKPDELTAAHIDEAIHDPRAHHWLAYGDKIVPCTSWPDCYYPN